MSFVRSFVGSVVQSLTPPRRGASRWRPPRRPASSRTRGCSGRGSHVLRNEHPRWCRRRLIPQELDPRAHLLAGSSPQATLSAIAQRSVRACRKAGSGSPATAAWMRPPTSTISIQRPRRRSPGSKRHAVQPSTTSDPSTEASGIDTRNSHRPSSPTSSSRCQANAASPSPSGHGERKVRPPASPNGRACRDDLGVE